MITEQCPDCAPNSILCGEKPARLLYPDVARTFATIGVIILHICGGMMWTLTPDMWQFKWLVSADTIVHCAVPLFLMLSGMFLLSPDKKITLSDVFRKYIFRLVAAYIGWSFFYAVFTTVIKGSFEAEGWYGIWRQFIDGRYHLWFLPMMIGVYLTTPFFRAVTKERNTQLLSYVFYILVLFNIVHPILDKFLPGLGSILRRITPSWFGIYATYFFAGYYFSRIKVSQFGRYAWLGILVISAFAVLYSVFSGSAALGKLDESKWSPSSLPIFLYTIAVYMTFRNYGDVTARSPRMHSFVRKLSEMSFTIYLCHDMFITILGKIGFHSLTWHPAISVPVLTVTVLICSMLLSKILIVCKMLVLRRCHR